MKTYLQIGIILIGSLVTPFVPTEMEFEYAYQTTPYVAVSATSTPQQPEFLDDDNNGKISVVVFSDKKGNIIKVQIPDSRYADMGKVDGYLKNPTKYEYLNIFETFAPKVEAAIAFDAFVQSADTSGTSITITTHTVTGSNMIGTAGAFGQDNTDTVTGITWNGVDMTKINDITITGNNTNSLWYIIAPTTGNIVASWSTSNVKRLDTATYSGAKQSAQPDASATASCSACTTLSGTVTVVAADSWVVGFGQSDTGNLSAGTDTVNRNTRANDTAYMDSNDLRAAGAQSIIETASSGKLTWNVASIAPFVAAVAVVRMSDFNISED